MTGENLRTWRIEHGLTQVQLAELLGVHRITVADWERGTSGRKIMESELLDLALRELARELAEGSGARGEDGGREEPDTAKATVTTVTQESDDCVREITREQAWELLNEQSLRELHMSLEDFIRKWQAGDYGEPDDNPDALELAALLPAVGVDPWRNGRKT